MPIEIDLTDFRPTPSQWAFLRDRTRIRSLMGGLGSGKSRTGAEAALDAALDNPGTSGMLVAPTFPMLHRLTLPAWEAACPKDLIVDHLKTERRYILRGNRSVWYGTAEVPESLEGTNLAWWWGDETRYWKRKSYQNMLARLRDKRARVPQAILTSTPEQGWMDEEFNRGLPERRIFRISTRENAANLAPGYIENLERSYSARLCESLIEGRFTVIEGQVYEVWAEGRHLVAWRYDPRFRTIVAMDFGVRKSSVLLAQETGAWPITTEDGRTIPPGSLVVFDELQPEQKPTERVLPMVREMLQRHGVRRVDAVFCDPAGRGRDIASGMTSVHLLRAEFGDVVRYETDPRETWIPTGIARVEGALSPLQGDPTLYVERRLAEPRQRTKDNDWSRGIVPMFRGLKYPEAKDGKPISDHPVKDGHLEHVGDCSRYLVMNAQLARGDHQGGTVGLRRAGY